MNKLLVSTYFPGYEIDPSKFGDRIEVVQTDKWFICKFMKYQYGNKLNKGDAVRSAVERIDSLGIRDSLVRVMGGSWEGLETPKAKATAKAKAMAKAKGSDSSSPATNRFSPPTPQEVTAYAQEQGFDLDGEKFCNHYGAANWMRGKTKITNWKKCVLTWKANTQGSARSQEVI